MNQSISQWVLLIKISDSIGKWRPWDQMTTASDGSVTSRIARCYRTMLAACCWKWPTLEGEGSLMQTVDIYARTTTDLWLVTLWLAGASLLVRVEFARLIGRSVSQIRNLVTLFQLIVHSELSKCTEMQFFALNMWHFHTMVAESKLTRLCFLWGIAPPNAQPCPAVSLLHCLSVAKFARLTPLF